MSDRRVTFEIATVMTRLDGMAQSCDGLVTVGRFDPAVPPVRLAREKDLGPPKDERAIMSDDNGGGVSNSSSYSLHLGFGHPS